MKSRSASPVGRVVSTASLPKKGLAVSIEADADQRRALAEAHALQDVARFAAELNVAPWRGDGVRVRGSVEADIVQQCVVSLDPIETAIRAPVDAVFLPEGSPLARPRHAEDGEMLIDPEGPDAPETFSEGRLDVGAVSEEFLALAIDPYPRKPDVDLPQETAAPSEPPAPSPLRDQLARLRRDS